MRLKVASSTDPGLEREENEDSVVVWRNKAGLDTLLVVCDGMGGHAAGQMASSIAVTTLTSVLAEDGDEGPDLDRLKRACKQANTAVFEAARDNPEWSGMGSTMVVAAIRGDEVGVLNVGDSPAYLFRNGGATLISQDHSWPAEQVRLGVIKPEEAATHPLKHRDLEKGAKRVIDRCRELGAPDNITVAVARIDVDVTKTQALPRLKKIGLMQKGAEH